LRYHTSVYPCELFVLTRHSPSEEAFFCLGLESAHSLGSAHPSMTVIQHLQAAQTVLHSAFVRPLPCFVRDSFPLQQLAPNRTLAGSAAGLRSGRKQHAARPQGCALSVQRTAGRFRFAAGGAVGCGFSQLGWPRSYTFCLSSSMRMFRLFAQYRMIHRVLRMCVRSPRDCWNYGMTFSKLDLSRPRGVRSW